jgi:hypothetical protein
LHSQFLQYLTYAKYLICNVKNHKDEPPIVLSTFGVDFERGMLDKILYVLVGNKRYAA